ncbi:MAG: lipid-A-disaccharide synthase [Muribaculaceae bacterium]
MKYFVIAGEASGDIHAARLISALRCSDAQAEFRFFGGDLMAEAAGCLPLVHYRDMAYMGFVEVARHLREILGFMRTARRCIDEWKPDAVVLVDYPSFNLKVAKYAHSKGIKAFYFISPKVWAWKEHRVKQIKSYITELYSILPFEPRFFEERHQYRVEYVGNPTVMEIAEARKHFATEADFRTSIGLGADDMPIVAVVPGSRRKEIADNLPVMIRACEAVGGVLPVIAAAPSIDAGLYERVLRENGCHTGYKLVAGRTMELVSHARVALVTSGTATLETAVIGTPQVVCYRMGGSRVLYNFYKMLLKVRYVSLPNLIADAPVVKELLMHHCSVENVAAELRALLPDSDARRAMLQGYADMDARLGNNDCAAVAANGIVAHLKKL